jgi:leucine dehydrogenase
MVKITEIFIPGYKKVLEIVEEKAKLHGFIAIHDTTLGPALGGVRIYPYAKPKEALDDALRLAKGMTYKSAIAEDGLGGGKSVIIADPSTGKTKALLFAFADALNTLNGEYIAAEDVGSGPEDMVILREKTPYVVALPTETSSGDPSYYTAWGVYQGLHAVAQQLWGSRSLKGRTVAIQGLGHVGSKIANLLFWEGAELILSDIDATLLHECAIRYGALVSSPAEIYGTKCDIFCPCAMGSVINDSTLPLLRCQAIAGSANNQLLTAEHGTQLKERNILYAPDYIINAGGIINVSVEFEQGGYNPKIARDRVHHIYDRLLFLFEEAERQQLPTNVVADQIALYNLKHQIGKRTKPLHFR